MATHTYGIPGTLQTTGITLDALAAGGKALGSAIDNNGGGTHANIKVTFQFGTAPAAGTSLALYALKSVDGTDYEDGDGAGETPPFTSLLTTIPCDARTSEQVVVVSGVPIPNSHFKLLVVNQAGQALDASGNAVEYETFNYESA